MRDPPTALARAALRLYDRLATYAGRLPQRLGERDFWAVQAGVVAATALHALTELWMFHGDGDVAFAINHIPVVLYLVPIAYAGLRYGMEGAVLTGLWSGVLTLPNLVLWHRTDFQWLELVYVALVIAVGIVMSVPVERERAQRRRAEGTVQRQVLLGDIATLTLTDDLPTTLDQTLRRLLHTLGLQATCVTVRSTDQAAEGEMAVLACHPVSSPATDALTASLQSPPGLTDRVGAAVSVGRDVVVPLSAELPGATGKARVDGFLAVTPDPARPLLADDLTLLAGVASHIAVAIANERLAESERSRLRSYAIAVTRAQEEERKRIARELHDEASQNLVVIRRRLADLAARLGSHPVAAELGELRDLAGQGVAGMRRFSRALRPPTLDELGMSSALEQLVNQVHERSGLATEFRVVGRYRRLPDETELAVFRIGQAALHNAELHARATSVQVELVFEPRRTRLSVCDDGCGFEVPRDLDALPELGKLGMVGMRERAELVGGTLQITSRTGAGTRVDLDVPG